MEEIKGLTSHQLYGMIKLQNQYYAKMKLDNERRAKEEAKQSLITFVVISTIVLLFGTMLYFSCRDPSMYIEADDGTLSINPQYMEMLRQERERQALEQYEEEAYYSEEEQE